MRRITAILIALALPAACTTVEAGQPIGTVAVTGQPPGSSAPPDDRYGAPPVRDPLDPSLFFDRPCSVLDKAQLNSFDITEPGETDDATDEFVGPGCTWFADSESVDGYGYTFLQVNENGLADTYFGRERGYWDAYFEPTTIDGYPAVFNASVDGRPTGNCNMTVGVSDDLTFQANVQLSDVVGQAACDVVRTFSTAIVNTLKASR